VREGAVHQARTLTSDTLGAFGRKVGDLAETLASGTSLMRICPVWLLGWISLCKQAVYGWLDDHAATMGAAIAYYTVFSLAPMLVMVIGVAGLAFGREAAEGALFGELAELIGPESAEAVQALLRSASSTRSGIVATAIGIGTLIIAGTAVFGQLQSALNVIWKAPASGNLGVWYLLKSRLLSLSVILVIGFLLLVSLVISTALAAFSDYLDRILAGLATILRIVHLTFSFGFTTVLFATMFKILPDHPVEWEEVWRGDSGPAIYGRQASDQPLHWKQEHGVNLRRCGRADHRFLVWVYYSAQILLLGAEFAKAHSDQRRARLELRQTTRAVS
jgi:membrane protein